MTDLPPKMSILYGALVGKGDVPVVSVHNTYFGEPEADFRKAMQRLGPYVTKLNRRLKNQKKAVKPGRLKGTYCLITL